MKKYVLFSLILIGVVVFSAAQTTGSFREEGIASYYHDSFQGKPTASGQLFDQALFTAAHPTLPFGTIVTVTNKQNNRRVTVRINDRGPFVAARIIDLSRAGAEALDMLFTGTAPVIVESAANTALGPVSPAAATTPAAAAPSTATPAAATQPAAAATAPVITQTQPVVTAAPQPTTVASARVPPVSYNAPPAVIKGVVPPMGSTKLYRMQVGAFRVPRNAVDVFERLTAAGLNPRYEPPHDDLYRVVLPELRAADIPAITQILGNSGFKEVLLREE